MKPSLFLPALFLLTVLFRSLPSYSQDRIENFRSVGALTGYGSEFPFYTDYRILFMNGDWSNSFRPPKKKIFLAWYAEPQFNVVQTNSAPEKRLDYEFGLNLGLRNYIRIGGSYFYQMLGSGPHYISAKIETQANGFIFSDNLAVGSFLPLKRSLYIHLQFGIRHISNAELKLPNRGVNTFVFRAGLSGIRFL